MKPIIEAMVIKITEEVITAIILAMMKAAYTKIKRAIKRRRVKRKIVRLRTVIFKKFTTTVRAIGARIHNTYQKPQEDSGDDKESFLNNVFSFFKFFVKMYKEIQPDCTNFPFRY